MDVADGNQVSLSVVRAEVGKGGKVVLKGGSKHGMPNELTLTWLDPPMEPMEED